MTLVMIFLHTFWGIIFFHGCETRQWWEVGTVVVTHLIVSGLVSTRRGEGPPLLPLGGREGGREGRGGLPAWLSMA